MKVFAIMASPQKGENTDLLLDSCISGVKAQDPGMELVKVYPHDMDIKFCVSCQACHAEGSAGCVVNDDMQMVYKQMVESDIWVFATPMYWWNMTAQMKVFFDRLYGMKRDAMIQKPKTAVLVTYGGPDPTEGLEVISKSFSNSFDYMGVQDMAFLSIITGDVHVRDNESARQKAFELGKKLAQ